MKVSLIILAAGLGNRYGGFKQIDSVGPYGEFIIDYSVFDAIRAGISKVVFVINRRIKDDFIATIGARVHKHIQVEYIFQEISDLPYGYTVPLTRKKPWGTGHAILSCLKVIEEPFIVINADDFYGKGSYATLYNYLKDTSNDDFKYSMLGFSLHNTLSENGPVSRGICNVNAQDYLENITEKTNIKKSEKTILYKSCKLSGNEPVSMNMWGFKPSLFEYLKDEFTKFLQTIDHNPDAEFFVPTVINTLLVNQKVAVKVLKTKNSWFGITYHEDKIQTIANIKELIKTGVYPENLWA